MQLPNAHCNATNASLPVYMKASCLELPSYQLPSLNHATAHHTIGKVQHTRAEETERRSSQHPAPSRDVRDGEFQCFRTTVEGMYLGKYPWESKWIDTSLCFFF